ncbi:MAG: hypothetical protein BJ554DRAFT_8316 [Olpidium bornovanus]|uniref:Uncharacterized protein n=1 Tax=Olpidium bornovanus TaxID=278681 RepID=A0A8H7ZUV1_9FUNG|nr:MAG: hypothetical protein BJ554DRAFT_8316 [Olpidium bornovanus]
MEPHEDLQACAVEDDASQASSCAPRAVQDKQHVHDAHVKFEDARSESMLDGLKTSAGQRSQAADASRQLQESTTVFGPSRNPSGEARENTSFTGAASMASLSATHAQPESPTSFRKQGKAEHQATVLVRPARWAAAAGWISQANRKLDRQNVSTSHGRDVKFRFAFCPVGRRRILGLHSPNDDSWFPRLCLVYKTERKNVQLGHGNRGARR